MRTVLKTLNTLLKDQMKKKWDKNKNQMKRSPKETFYEKILIMSKLYLASFVNYYFSIPLTIFFRSNNSYYLNYHFI